MRALSKVYPVCIALTVCSVAGHTAVAVDAERGVVRLALSAEPPNLNSMRASDRLSAFVLLHTNEGLTRYDHEDRLAPGVAKRWVLDDRGARFWLRRDARWEDGRPVTAADFVFSWREALRPETASPYAAVLYPLRNARAVNTGRLPVGQLGVKAVGDYELVVEFDQPCAYFPALTAFTTLLPVNEAFYRDQGARFASDAGRLLANGPYRLTDWVHGASLRLDANVAWRDSDQLKIKRIEIPYITSDTSASLNLFRDGRIALSDVQEESLGDVLTARWRLRSVANGALHFLRFNLRPGRSTANPRLREAIADAIDVDQLVNRVVRVPGVRVSNSLFPSTVQGNSGPLFKQYPLPPRGHSASLARKLDRLSESERQRLEKTGLTLLVSDAPQARRIAEYIQASLGVELNIRLRIDRQAFKQRLLQAAAGQFDLELSNWLPDYNDPMTYADLFASWNPNNRGAYASERYDFWIETAQSTTNQAIRMQAMDRIQHIIAEDLPILPLFEGVTLYVQHPRLRGVVRSRFGPDPNLQYAWIEPR